jgi:serine/threonine-protein kinase
MSEPMAEKAELSFGTLIDNRYMIQRVLGQGGLGRTYLAFDTHRFNEACVLKEFAPSGSGEYSLQKCRDLFKREARILHQIEHPQIPEFLACFEGQERLFLVQEYVDGKTYSTLLKERQQQNQAFSEADMIQWLRSLLPILEYIHERGIIHRDISPDNIMLPHHQALPVLIDFGVGKQLVKHHPSKHEDSSNSDHASFVGKVSFVGKIGYAPREQISMGQCSASSDLYALGVAAVVLLTGKEPTLLMDQYSLEWQWRSYTEVGDSFAQVLENLLADKPRERYQSAQEVLAEVQQLRQPGATIVSPPPKKTEFEAKLEEETPPPPRQPEATAVSHSSRESDLEIESQTSLSPAFIERCQRELAYYVGPMASLIVEETTAQDSPQSAQQLVEALAAEIPDPQQAIQFKQSLW